MVLAQGEHAAGGELDQTEFSPDPEAPLVVLQELVDVAERGRSIEPERRGLAVSDGEDAVAGRDGVVGREPEVVSRPTEDSADVGRREPGDLDSTAQGVREAHRVASRPVGRGEWYRTRAVTRHERHAVVASYTWQSGEVGLTGQRVQELVRRGRLEPGEPDALVGAGPRAHPGVSAGGPHVDATVAGDGDAAGVV